MIERPFNERPTVDSGEWTDVRPGLPVTWLHAPRGGYGYLVPVDAVVVDHAGRPRTWVVIEIALRDGRKVKRRVDVANLRFDADALARIEDEIEAHEEAIATLARGERVRVARDEDGAWFAYEVTP